MAPGLICNVGWQQASAMLLRGEASILLQHGTAAQPARLLAAQEQLIRRRRQCRQERIAAQLPVRTDEDGRLLCPPEEIAISPRPPAPTTPLACQSVPYERSLRAAHARRETAAAREDALSLAWLPVTESQAASDKPDHRHRSRPAQPIPDTVRLYPDLALSMLREDLVAPGRLWLLLRHLDDAGRGWLTGAQAREHLTGKHAPLRLCGKRQLRNLLAKGDGIFWQRNRDPGGETRIWLRSVFRVAATLGVARLSLHPIALPLTVLLSGIGQVRAHFYASYHSGRRQAQPIARETLAAMSAVSRRSQHTYERKAKVERQKNWALGAPYTREEAQNRAWEHGRALFKFTDRKGTHGRAGAAYLAWQLPNSYEGPHAAAPNGRQKRINRKLVDLFMKGMTGNGKREIERAQQPLATAPERRFYGTGEAAARGYNNAPENDAYWSSHATHRTHRIWHLLPGRRESDA